ncbi:glycosyltransferase family 9 protein [Cryptosporangium arvum]|uniref:ADP-heptose:LPS heptosyltransferase n=1 Tax=Cryptosporangium arvum DSM 44712 TaxID=927661 RepID=A0A010ZSP2_9ACTN|nr:glycosyltransferase family 9 protein [Cryptosporangium arvum]EXG81714.1 ADP-heptose:LPS heptosyltransferase [Cryptosporangium arvum DSM 44712]
MSTVLVLRALGLGDLLTAVPALRGLRRAYPGHEIVLAAPARFADVVAATGVVDRLLPTVARGREVPSRLDWDGTPPDVAVDLHGNGRLSRELLAALRPGRILSWVDGPAWRDDEHERVRWCRLLRWYGIASDPDDVRLDVVGTPGPGAVLIHPGADAAARRWPADRFAAVARAVAAAGLPVTITAGRGEGALAGAVAERAGLPPGAVVGGDGDVPFGALAGRVAGARAVVVGDTGIAHLASAVATPSVVLFGPVSPALWGPPAHPRHRVLWRADDPAALRPGDAHGTTPDARLLRVGVPDVLTGLGALGIPVDAALSGAAR